MKTKHLHLLLFVLLCTIFSSHAQSEYGKVSMEELEMTSYPQDETASAVILSKKGETRFVYNELYGFQFEFTFSVKIKILKSEGLEYCNASIEYTEIDRQNKENITGLNGKTYNLVNGKIEKTKLSKEFIFDENIDNKLKVKKFTMPAAKVGSVIEYKYTLTSDFFYELRSFTFQNYIPTVYTSYEITIPEYFKYNTNMQGYERIASNKKDVNESFLYRYKDNSGRVQTDRLRCSAEQTLFEGKDLPAIKKEPYLWTLNDYISKVSFELKTIQFPYETIKSYSTTWNNIDEKLMKGSVGDNIKKTGLFKNEITAGETTLDKAREIQNMIKSKVKWNDSENFYPSDLKDALKKGIGNSADINYLLINALNAAKFDAYPVILSTRSNGRLPVTYPSITAFDYIITAVQIDTTTYYTDASAKYGDWNILPKKVMVPQARILKDKYGYWVDLSTVSNGRIVTVGQVSFEDNKSIKKINNTWRGLAGFDFRNHYSSFKDENEYIEKLTSIVNGEVENFKLENIDNTAIDAKSSYTVKNDVSLEDDIIYINPMVTKHITENPFKSETRTFPINFDYLSSYSQMVTINVPEGYEIDEVPTSQRYIFGENVLSFTYRIVAQDSQIQLQYQYNVNQLLVLSDEYADLRDFFAKMVQKNSEQIVLKKIK